MRVINATWGRPMGQCGNLARCIHPHFLNGKITRGWQAGDCQGHADMIVEAALAGMGLAKAGQCVGQHIFAAGFANRPGDTDHAAVEPAASGRGRRVRPPNCPRR